MSARSILMHSYLTDEDLNYMDKSPVQEIAAGLVARF